MDVKIKAHNFRAIPQISTGTYYPKDKNCMWLWKQPYERNFIEWQFVLILTPDDYDIGQGLDIPLFGEDMENSYSFQIDYPNGDFEIQAKILHHFGFQVMDLDGKEYNPHAA